MVSGVTGHVSRGSYRQSPVTMQDEASVAAALPPEDEPVLAAPPVVLVVVSHDSGPWFEQTLRSIGSSDYPNLTVVVVDAASATDPAPLVQSVLPRAVVRRLDDDPGYGPAANHVLHVVEGATFFAFCHDDVLLEPATIRDLVEEAYRSNAGVVGPKIVAWGRPDRLLDVGLTADKTGVPSTLVERGELDQEQHDGVRDVFAVPGACCLVRADLFKAIGGFDPAITRMGEDVDLCWRVQVAGARVMVVPAARVQHREELPARRPTAEQRQLAARHRLRSVLTCYGPFHLVRVLPQVLFLTVLESVAALFRVRPQAALRAWSPWAWNLRQLHDIRERRRLVAATRQLHDTEVRRLQRRGSARLNAFVEHVVRGDRHAPGVGRGITTALASGPARVVLGTWLVLAVVLLLGSRALLGHGLPAVGSFAAFDEGPFSLLHQYVAGWRPSGLGHEGAAPTALALLGLSGLVFVGAMGLLQQVLVLGALPLGLIGAWRLTSPLSSRARCVGVVVYASVPLPYAALERGHWGALLVYAAAPWLLRRLASVDEAPFLTESPPRPWWQAALVLGLGEAVLAAFVPLVVLLVPVVAVALTLGAVLVGRRPHWAPLAVAAGASVVAVALNLPWSAHLLAARSWSALAGVDPLAGDDLGFGDLLRFAPADHLSLPVLGWAVLAAAAVPLLIGKGWRLAWAARAWTVATVCWALALAGTTDLLPVPLPDAGILLAPGAAALALAAALGLTAFEVDLSGYRFGWRQVASLVALVAVAVGALPVLVRAGGGRWEMPSVDFDRTLAFLEGDEVRADGGFRVLWLGDRRALPLAGQDLSSDLAFALSVDGSGRLAERWAAPADAGADLLVDALRRTAGGGTERLGRLLAPFGIRYVALVDRAAPARTGVPERPLPGGLVSTVDQQLDLRRVGVSDEAVQVYENVAWLPMRAALDPDAASAAVAVAVAPGALVEGAVGLDLSGAAPALPDGAGPEVRRGDVDAGTIYVAEAASDRWRLDVGGAPASRRPALGWGMAFDAGSSGPATLRHLTPWSHPLLVACQGVLWLLAVALVVRRRRSGRAA